MTLLNKAALSTVRWEITASSAKQLLCPAQETSIWCRWQNCPGAGQLYARLTELPTASKKSNVPVRNTSGQRDRPQSIEEGSLTLTLKKRTYKQKY
jgi:hypothetical protein